MKTSFAAPNNGNLHASIKRSSLVHVNIKSNSAPGGRFWSLTSELQESGKKRTDNLTPGSAPYGISGHSIWSSWV